MSEWIWLNGEIVSMGDARIHPEDRGYQFADGVYEVFRLYNGKPFAYEAHLDRLDRSCAGIEMTPPARAVVTDAINQLLARCNPCDGMIYLQATRGESPRNHLIPTRLRDASAFRGTLLCYARPLAPMPAVGQARGVRLLSQADERWKRCWVKSIALLPNVLAKNHAIDAGADEAVFVDEGGIITECSATNIFAVIDGCVVTHPVGPKVLPGITRQVLLKLAGGLGIEVQERPWTTREAATAQEMFITSTTREIDWVSQLDEIRTAAYIGKVTRALAMALRAETAAGGGTSGPQP